jgi:DNA-binding transcriptional ArsR family regulator
MIYLRLLAGAVANVRFTYDPLWECVASVRALVHPARHALHRPWVAEARPMVERARLPADRLAAVASLVGDTTGYMPDFIAPPPLEPQPRFADELARLAATPLTVVRSEVGRRGGRGDAAGAALARRARTDPGGLLAELTETVSVYWDRVFARYWKRLEAVLEGEILFRSRALALHGAAGLFADMAPGIAMRGESVAVEYLGPDMTRRIGRSGLLLVPSLFSWPDVLVTTDRPWRTTLYYPARGVGALWSKTESVTGRDTLALVAGRTRARVLYAIETPVTTTEVAQRLRVTAGAVSQHLARLTRAGLAHRTRIGRRVFYAATARAQALLKAAQSD